MAEQADLRATLRLHLADGVGAITFGKLVAHFGDARSAAAVPASQFRLVEGVGDKTAAAIAAVTDDQVEQELALADKHGVRLICQGQPEYPPALGKIHDPPPVLYVMGNLAAADAVSLAVVGSRRCTHYGLEQAERFGGLLGRAGLTVISGGARGIDAAAHHGALSAGGRTIAVMGCGLCEFYPPENAKLFRQIVESGQGAVISELPMRTAVLPGNFPNRNRIISGLALGVLVVEAARRSGSLITARLAVEQGKEVFALPGRVDSPFSQGTNALIAAGQAALVQDLPDILESMGKVGSVLKAEGGEAPPPESPTAKPQLTLLEAKLVETLTGGELSLDELIRRSNQPGPAVTAAMTMLSIKGVVSQQPGGVFGLRRNAPA